MHKSFTSHYLDVYGMTPEHLRSVADRMDKDGIEYIELSLDYDQDDLAVEERSHRQETPEEIRQREELIEKAKQQEKIDKKQRVIDRKIFQIKSALALKIEISEPPVKTLTPDVYWVYKGCVVGGQSFNKSGFVRYKNGSYGPVVKKEKDA